jgi:hypothetical protein
MGIRASVVAGGLAGSAAIALTACGGSAAAHGGSMAASGGSATASGSTAAGGRASGGGASGGGASGSGASGSGSSGQAASGGTPGGGAVARRSTATLISQMKAAVNAATSMHLAGQLPNGGRPVALDLGVHRAGDLAGTITQNGVPLRLIGAEGNFYVKATLAFLRELRAPTAVCAVMCGKYVQMSDAQGSELAAGLSMASLTRSLIAGLPKFRQAGTATVGGRAAVVLRGADGSTLDVAARGKPYPLRLAAPVGRHESVVFSQWNTVATPGAPRSGEVINLNQLKAGSS